MGDVGRGVAGGLGTFSRRGLVPVRGPLTRDGQGHILNTNADTSAGESAKELARLFDVTLVFCFEKKGVLSEEDNEESVIPVLTPGLFEQYVAEGIIKEGMIPKLENSFSAIDAGVSQVIITSASAIGKDAGTVIKK